MGQSDASGRHVFLIILEGALFWVGLAFLQGETVVTNFITATTGSVALAGLAATLRSVSLMVGQFIAGMFIHKVKKQSRLMGIIGFIGRPLFLLMLPLLMTGVGGRWAAGIFLFIYGLFFLLDGIIALFWVELCTRTLPIRKRGETITLQQTFGGLGGFVVGLVLKNIMGGDLSFETQYIVIFSIASAILMIDAVVLAMLKDEPHDYEPEKPIPQLGAYVKGLFALFVEDKPVRTLLIARACYVLTLISVPINLTFGVELGGLLPAQTAILVFMPVIGQTVAGVLWSQVCRRLGYPIMMAMAQSLGILCALTNLLCFIMAMMGMPVMVPLSAAMILLALNMPTYIAFTQHMIVLAPERRRPDYLVMSSLVLAPLAFGTYLAGLIVEHFGYLPVYLIMLVSGILGLYLVRANFSDAQGEHSA